MRRSTLKVSNLKVLLSFACCFLLSCLASCSGSGSQRTLLGYVPSSSYAVLAVNWKTVSRDPDLKRICKGAEIEKLFAELGLGETVTEFAVYGDPGGLAQASNGIVVKGSFNANETVKELKRRGWTEQGVEGRRIYVNPKDASWLTPFDRNVFVLGTESAVRDAIGASGRSESRFTSRAAYKVLSSHFVEKQHPILMMVVLPQASQDLANVAVQLTSTAMDLAGVGPLGDLLSKIGTPQGLACGISHRDELFPVAVSAVMKDEESAKLVSGALNLLKSLGGMASHNYANQTNDDATRAIRTMSIDRNREVVFIKMAMSRRDLGTMYR